MVFLQLWLHNVHCNLTPVVSMWLFCIMVVRRLIVIIYCCYFGFTVVLTAVVLVLRVITSSFSYQSFCTSYVITAVPNVLHTNDYCYRFITNLNYICMALKSENSSHWVGTKTRLSSCFHLVSVFNHCI